MADSFTPIEEDSFVPLEEEKDSFVPIKLPGPGPKSEIIPPTGTQPKTLDEFPPTALEPDRTVALRPDNQPSTPLPAQFQPSEEDIVQISSMVKPEEREIARQVLQRDVKTREDMNILQGKLADFGEKHGFGFTANLVEDLLNPLSLAEIEMVGALGQLGKVGAFKVLQPILPPTRLKQVLGVFDLLTDGAPTQFAERAAARRAVDAANGMALPTSPTEIAQELELAQKQSQIMKSLELPDNLGNMTPNDPTGVMKKRLALPGESGFDIVQAERGGPDDPMGVMAPRSYRVVPASKPVPEDLIRDWTPDGINALRVNSESLAEEAAATIPNAPLTNKVTKSDEAGTRVLDNVRNNVIGTGEDLALYSDSKRAIQAETEDFGDPTKIVETLKASPMTTFQTWVNRAQSFYNSGIDMAKKMGPLGEHVSRQYQEAMSVAALRMGKVFKVVNDLFGEVLTSPEARDNFVDVMENGAEAISEPIRKAAIAARGMFDQVIHEAQQVGITDTGVYRENYWPHMLDVENLSKPGTIREGMIQRLMADRKLAREEAVKVLDTGLKNGVRRFGPLESARVANLPGYSTNVRGVMEEYFYKAFRRIETAKQFGVNNEKASILVEAFPDLYQKETMDAVLELMTGKNSAGSAAGRYAYDSLKGANGLLSKSMMGLSAIMNSAQGFLGANVRNGMKPAFEGVIKAFSKMGKQEAEEAGVLLERYVQLFDDEAAKSSGFFTRNGFDKTEAFNRVLASDSENTYIRGALTRELKKNPDSFFLRRELERLGVNAEKVIARGSFSDDEVGKAVINSVKMTQGGYDPASMPILANTPWGRTMYALKSFDLLWFKFIRDNVLSEAKHGNFTPAMRLGLWGTVTGEAAADIWAGINGKERPTDAWERALENFSYAGSIGIASNLLSGMIEGKKGAANRLLTPPLFSMLAALGDAGVDLRNGKFASTMDIINKRVVTPGVVYAAGAVNPLAGIAAGVGTRALLSRFVKERKEMESEE